MERLFNTLQDRLIAEMRLNKIRTMKQANDFLQNVYLPSHNAKFMVLPRNMQGLYRPIHPSYSIDEIFCMKEYRILGNDHTISWCNERYMIANELKFSIARQRLEIRLYSNKPWTCHFAGIELKLVKVEKVKKLVA